MRYVKGCALAAACMLCVSCGARQDKMADVEKDTLEVQNALREMEQRMAAMESRMESVSTDVGMLVTRTSDAKGKPAPRAKVVEPPRNLSKAAVLPTKVRTPAPDIGLPPVDRAVSAASAAPVSGGGSPALPPISTPQSPAAPRTVNAPPDTGKIVPAGGSVSSAPALPPATSPSTSLPPVSPHAAGTDAPALPPEVSGDAAGASVRPASSTIKPAAPVKGEDAAYKAALALATSGRSAAAQAKFQEFLQTYPSSRYAPNAHYWIGECLYAQRRYADALLQFKEVTARYPRHHKSADALLKAGMTYNRLGDKENASLQYKALMADFPKSEAARRVPREQR